MKKTLTVAQLFELDNPLWTIGLSAGIIYDILGYYKQATENGWADQFSGLLDRIITNNYKDYWIIYTDYLKQLEMEK